MEVEPEGRPPKVSIEDGDHVYHCQAVRQLAEDIAGHRGRRHVRVTGTGTFTRHPDEGWLMSQFTISSYEVLDDRDLVETVAQLREITERVGLDDDIISRLAALRSDGPA